MKKDITNALYLFLSKYVLIEKLSERRFMDNNNFLELMTKKALGFEVEEVQEEYGDDNGELKLIKKKIIKKFIPPDSIALKYLLDDKDDNMNNLSYEELIKEKDKVLEELNNLDDNNSNVYD